MNTKRNICVISGSRAEYGLLRGLIKKIDDDSELNLQLILTGTHLSKKHGNTLIDVENDGFRIDSKVDILNHENSQEAISEAISKAVFGITKSLNSLKPDLIVILGDRFEILAAAIAAQVCRIPVAHIHGGESTEGLIDEAFRHSITKMSHLHFVATNDYRNRVIQLGEQPKNTHLVGALGIDSIMNEKLLTKPEVERMLTVKFQERNLLVTFHPVTLESGTAKRQMQELLNALSKLRDTTLIFTMPNADMESHTIFEMIHEFSLANPNSFAFKSLGQKTYFSCVALVDGVVGNSSSGLIEVPTFKKGTINIGDRQLGRIQAKSTINCAPDEVSINNAIKVLYSKEFQNRLLDTINPYGIGGASEKIFNVIKSSPLDSLLKKKFYNLETK